MRLDSSGAVVYIQETPPNKGENPRPMKRLIQCIADPGTHDKMSSFGLLLLRVLAGGFMIAFHGWGKLVNFGEKSDGFLDPLGLGSATSLGLAVFAEVFCALAVVLGLFTRAAAVPLIITMLVAAFLVHADDPFQKQEFALLYAFSFLTLVFTGAGAFSIDSKLKK